MAISANTVWEVRTAGNDTNGGAFVTGATGTDYSQQDNKNTATGTDDSTTDAVANGTTTITSATANFGTTIVGNIIYLQGGTGALTATRRQVTARTNATTITVDATVAAGTGITMNIGGAMASLGGVGFSLPISGNIIYIKSGSYSITSASSNVANGCFNRASTEIYIYGYGSTRDDFGTKPVFTASGISSFTIIAGGASSTVANLELNGAGLTSSKGINWSGHIYNCIGNNFTSNAFTFTTGVAINCYATGCSSTPAFSGDNAFDCVAHANTFTGFSLSGLVVRCMATNNTGASSNGFLTTAIRAAFINCVAYGNGQFGFQFANAQTYAENCISEDNVRGFYSSANANAILWVNCAAFSNSTADFTLGTGKACFNRNSITYSASAFTNAGAGDFSLNNTAGGGADLRAAGHPGIFPGALTTGYIDIGAAQHQDTGGGGGEHSAVF